MFLTYVSLQAEITNKVCPPLLIVCFLAHIKQLPSSISLLSHDALKACFWTIATKPHANHILLVVYTCEYIKYMMHVLLDISYCF
jgi:hypothetical protein